MSLSLRDQLLKAGLVTEKQVQNAERQQKRDQFQQPRGRKKPTGPTPQQLAAQKAQAEKAARDADLNRKKQEKADRKAKFAEIKQLVAQHQVARVETDEFYNFVDGTKIRRVCVSPEQRDRLVRGELAIVRNEGRYAFVPPAIAADIRSRVERAVIHHNVPRADESGDDPYKDFVVPDDLMW
ncbi:MAG: hypothetical protein RLZZ393_2015 [Pseudomonadota bacterium]|jgi:uncharacterized protein YaiL (DUF2058 family)